MNILIVGAGLSGAVVASELAKNNKITNIDIIEVRNHIAGNLYDYKNEDGVYIHKYGPHIWHTNDKNIHDYISQYTEWIEYKHKVKALLKNGQYVTLPANKETKEILDSLGYDIIETLFRPYSEKMWGMKLEELNPNIINRVPIRDDMNDLYFPKDKYQGLPKNGYTSIIQKMLSSDKINIKLNTPFNKDMIDKYDYIFNSMAIDEYFDYSEGVLPYRSLKFHTFTVQNMDLPTPTINFTDKNKYTRMTEWKKYPGNPKVTNSTITLEEPCDFKDNNMERYYPIQNSDNIRIYNKYKTLVPDNMLFIGRCGLYKYIDMDDAIKLSLETVKIFLNNI
jgi:UDP-galactopyranose mutase